MNGTVLALSLSRSLSELGALVALACLVGVALLALIFFVQGKELRRLQEWASQLRSAPLGRQRGAEQPPLSARPLAASQRQRQPVLVQSQPAASTQPPPIPTPPPPAAGKVPPAPANAGQPFPNLTPPARLPDPSEFRFLREEGAGRGRFAVIAVAAAIAVGVAAYLVSGSGGNQTVAASSTTTSATHTSTAAQANPKPGEVAVTVLNPTEINGLAHRVAAQLQGAGYTRAQALNGRPPGTYTTTVVEYKQGFKGAAERLARALALEGGSVRPLEGGVAALAGGAPLVVIATGSAGEEGQTQPPPTTAEATEG